MFKNLQRALARAYVRFGVIGVVRQREDAQSAVKTRHPHVYYEEEEVSMVVLSHAVPYPCWACMHASSQAE